MTGDWPPFGYRQSPIEFNMYGMIYSSYDPAFNPLQTSYGPAKSYMSIKHENTLQISFDGPAGELYLGKSEYNLKQFHFHHPPEHTFKQYPEFCDQSSLSKTAKSRRGQTDDEFVLEMHLVHETFDGEIAVIAVFFKLGEEPNEFLDKFWDHMESIDHEGTPVGRIDVADLDLSHTYIHYSGSLTTPDYDEGVLWTVMCGNWNTMSYQQLEKYKAIFPGENNREIQPLNGRLVMIKYPSFFGAEIQQKRSSSVQSS